MISGKYLLERDEDIISFYKKRFSKIVIPLLFWGILYSVFTYFGENLRGTHVSVLKIVVLFIKGVPFMHMWYLYMLIGLYAVTPFLNKLIKKLPNRFLWVITIIFVIFSIIHAPKNGAPMNEFPFPFPFWFIDFLGYYMLGHLLTKIKQVSNPILVVIGFISWGVNFYAILRGFPDDVNAYFYGYGSLFVAIGSISFYKFFLQLNLKKNWFSYVAAYSFGIYLIHPLILVSMRQMYKPVIVNVYLSVPIFFVVAFIGSLLITIAISKIKYLKSII